MSKIFDKFIMMVISGSLFLSGISILILNFFTKTNSLSGLAIILLIAGFSANFACFFYNHKKTAESKESK